MFWIAFISPADLVPSALPSLSGPFSKLKVECFRILIALCISLSHSCHGRTDCVSLKDFISNQIKRQTVRLSDQPVDVCRLIWESGVDVSHLLCLFLFSSMDDCMRLGVFWGEQLFWALGDTEVFFSSCWCEDWCHALCLCLTINSKVKWQSRSLKIGTCCPPPHLLSLSVYCSDQWIYR